MSYFSIVFVLYTTSNFAIQNYSLNKSNKNPTVFFTEIPSEHYNEFQFIS